MWAGARVQVIETCTKALGTRRDRRIIQPMGKRRKTAPEKPAREPAAAKRRRGETPGKGAAEAAAGPPPEEFGGPPGPEPTRYGDWQIKGRVSDF